MDYPYEVPANWKWVRLSDLYLINPKNNADSELDVAFVPMEMISAGMNSQFNFSTQKWGKVKKGHTHFRDGDVAFAKISPCFENRKSMIINNLPNGIGAGTTELIVLRNPKILQTYTYWIVNSENFIQGGRQTYSGTVGQQRISMDYVKDYLVPLAPLPEQHRIVARIEALFSKLDEAKEKAQSVLDSFENRRVAILHKAFTGELTKKWRYERGISFDSWENKALKDCCSIGSGGTPSRKNPEYYRGNIVWIKSGEINWTDVYASEEHISQAAIVNSSARLYPAESVLVAMYGVTRGRAAILKISATTNQAVCVLQPKSYLLNSYLFYYFMRNYWDIQSHGIGSAQLNLSGTIISKFQIRIPTLDEQLEIVRILDRVLFKEQQAKQAAETVIAQIDVMKKSILARAFRGELGTNDPNDEPARI